EVAGLAALVGCSEALGGVFDDGQIAGGGLNGVDVGTLAIERDGENGAGAGGDGCGDTGGVKVICARVNVHEDGLCAEQRDHLDGGDEGEGRGDDLIFGADAKRHEGNEQGVGPAGAGNAMACAGALGQRGLKFADFGAEDELPMIEDRLDAGVDARLKHPVLRFEVDKFHQQWTIFSDWMPLVALRVSTTSCDSATMRG